MDCTLLVAYQNVPERIFIVEKLVIKFHDLTSRVPEDCINSLCNKGFENGFGPGNLLSDSCLVCIVVHK